MINITQRFEEFVKLLNEQKIGSKVLLETEKLLGKYRVYGLEERIISAVMEAVSWDIILTNDKFDPFSLEMKPQQHRTFYDALFLKDHPMDFKGTKGVTQDNLSAQGALLYCVSGDKKFAETNKRLSSAYVERFENACENALSNNKDFDFYYLILNKITGIYSFTTLRTLSSIKINQSNFLQASWAENIDKSVPRTLDQFISWITPIILEYKGYKE